MKIVPRLFRGEPSFSESGLMRITILGCCCLLFAVAASAQQATAGTDSTTPIITTFDAPGAGTEAGQGTFAKRINAAGVVAGDYVDASYVSHG
jgi:hypothetical protein